MAFTLAEVLITLGIIGVVAALTMPALIQNHRRTVVETALKKFYTTINQAINLSIVENNATRYWSFGVNTPAGIEEFYNQYLRNYLSVLKTDVVNVKLNKNGSMRSMFTVYLSDGSAASLDWQGHDWYYCIKAKDLEKFADKRGTGCFMFGLYPVIGTDPIRGESYSNKNFNNKGLEPYVINVAVDEDGIKMKDENDNYIHTTENDLYTQKCYAKVIQLNGWKIPDDYPLKF